MAEQKQYVILPEAPKPGEKLPEVINNPDIEHQWAVTASMHAETYFKLIQSVSDHSKLRLTKIDDELYKKFRETFPHLKVETLKDEDLKSESAKNLWRPFLMSFENRVPQWNMLTLLRGNSKEDYTEENTLVVPRIQFFCIEVARLKEGHNRHVILSSSSSLSS